jgi:phosphoribosylformimino-5-aminoimidazole carboxamide ribotide isomerase
MIEIIPAIDIYQGKCVRLTKGDYKKMTVYHDHPVELARQFETHGIKRVHLVDLEGASIRKIANLDILKGIARSTELHIDFGGGINTAEDLDTVFQAGAEQAVIGSLAVKMPELFDQWIKKFGSEKFILGADALNGKVAVSGWSELSNRDLEEFLQEYIDKGIEYVLSTDISRDGMMQGASVELYKSLRQKFPLLNIIASGGITSISEIEELESFGIYGVIIGKALYEKKILIEDLLRFIK